MIIPHLPLARDDAQLEMIMINCKVVDRPYSVNQNRNNLSLNSMVQFLSQHITLN